MAFFNPEKFTNEAVAKLKTELAELRLKYKDSRELDLYYINKYLDK